jgi:hypothetical protein
MRILTLKVEDAVADMYNAAQTPEKQKIEKIINNLLKELLKKDQASYLFSKINEISGSVAASGLTIEKMGEIMNWDAATLKNLFGDAPVHS